MLSSMLSRFLSTEVLVFFPLLPLCHPYSGDMTYYDPGLGSCGYSNGNNDNIVALSTEVMQNGDSSNSNPKCGTQISIWSPHSKQAHQATIVDTCPGCAKYDIDVSPALFQLVAPDGDGRVHGIDWGGPAVGG